MDLAQLEGFCEHDRMQYVGRKASRFPLSLPDVGSELSYAQRLVRRGLDGLYIDACTAEDMVEREYEEAFPHGYEYQQYQDKVRLLIHQSPVVDTQSSVDILTSSVDDEETLVGDSETEEDDDAPGVAQHPWWIHFFDPQQEHLTNKQADWVFKITFILFVAFLIVTRRIWQFLQTFGLCLLIYGLAARYIWKRHYNWRQIDLFWLQEQDLKPWTERIKSGCNGAKRVWTALKERTWRQSIPFFPV